MKKRLFIGLSTLITVISYAQVGIDTEEPKATLDVVAKPNDPSKS